MWCSGDVSEGSTQLPLLACPLWILERTKYRWKKSERKINSRLGKKKPDFFLLKQLGQEKVWECLGPGIERRCGDLKSADHSHNQQVRRTSSQSTWGLNWTIRFSCTVALSVQMLHFVFQGLSELTSVQTNSKLHLKCKIDLLGWSNMYMPQDSLLGHFLNRALQITTGSDT